MYFSEAIACLRRACCTMPFRQPTAVGAQACAAARAILRATRWPQLPWLGLTWSPAVTTASAEAVRSSTRLGMAEHAACRAAPPARAAAVGAAGRGRRLLARAASAEPRAAAGGGGAAPPPLGADAAWADVDAALADGAAARRAEELALRRRKLNRPGGARRRARTRLPWPRATSPRDRRPAAGSAEVEAEAARELSLRGRRILAASFGNRGFEQRQHPGTPPRRVPLTRRESDSSAEGAARVYPERPVRLSSRG